MFQANMFQGEGKGTLFSPLQSLTQFLSKPWQDFFLVDIDKIRLKFLWKGERTRKIKINLKKNNEVRESFYPTSRFFNSYSNQHYLVLVDNGME